MHPWLAEYYIQFSAVHTFATLLKHLGYFNHLLVISVACLLCVWQITKGCFLFESMLKCSWKASPSKAYSYLVTFLHGISTTTMQPIKALLQGQMCKI